MAGKGGGAWKVAYADFVTAMMAFFMVMWITSQDQKLKEAIAHHFSDPFGAKDHNGKSGGVDNSGPPFNMNDNKRLAIKPRIMLEQVDRRFQIGSVVYFKGNSSELESDALESLDLLIPSLRWEAPQIEILGFADKKPTGAGESNPWVIANQRCLAIKEYIESKGIMDEKIKLSQGTSGKIIDPKLIKKPFPSGYSYIDRVEIRIPPNETN